MAKSSERKLAALPHHEQRKERKHASGQSVGGHGGRILAARAGARQENLKTNWLQLSVPELFGRQTRAFGHRLELRPDDLRGTHTRTETTVSSSQNIFAPDYSRVPYQTVSDRLRVLDDIRRMTHDARYEHLAGREFHLLPDTPFVLVTGIGRFNGDRVRFDLENEIDDVAQRNVVFVRAMIAAPTSMKPHPVGRDVAQPAVECVDTELGIPPLFGDCHVGHELPTVGQIRVVDLQ